ncbi:ABC-three component system protein [Marinobacter mangrovi]|uniref:ABC-three component system protein n=1 Tax=Marinobacter mangrovi TaxID=2803918 RepID=UPI001F39E9A6|nr:ABC-three component system protein [Marinobacter mangrovi]
MAQKDNFPMPSPGDGRVPKSIAITGNDISGNDIGGDLNVGSTIVKLPSFDVSVGAGALKDLIKKHNELAEDSPEYIFLIEQLQSKIKACESRKMIGLEGKLKKAGKKIYYDQALVSSQKASKTITRFQHVKSYQIIFNHVLGLILTRFNSYILPLIKNGTDDVTLKSAINTTIVEPLYQEVSMAGGMISADLIEGMLYFLTEKCHVEWV